jgi:hypothetical protein
MTVFVTNFTIVGMAAVANNALLVTKAVWLP